MRCHTCGYVAQPPHECPECGSINIIFRSIGTKFLLEEVQRLFPRANLGRYDSDNNKSQSLGEQYEAIRRGDIDILVGTQILGKGLDLPRLSVLGLVMADQSLTFPDYTAEERTFQLLLQALGRIHRGHVPGKAYIQTYQPRSSLLNAAIQNDYQSFYKSQLVERHTYHFPPFRYLLKLTCARATSAGAQRASNNLAATLKRPGLEVIGPSPAFAEKVQNRYRWQVIIKSRERPALVEVIHNLPPNWTYDIDPINLL